MTTARAIPSNVISTILLIVPAVTSTKGGREALRKRNANSRITDAPRQKIHYGTVNKESTGGCAYQP